MHYKCFLATIAAISIFSVGDLRADGRSGHGTHAHGAHVKVHEHMQALSRQHDKYLRSYDSLAQAQARLEDAATNGETIDYNDSEELMLQINNMMSEIESLRQVASSMKGSAQRAIETMRDNH